MPLAQIAQFTRYVAADPDGVDERLTLLTQHRARVLDQLEQLNQSLTVIDQKITDYTRRTQSHVHYGSD